MSCRVRIADILDEEGGRSELHGGESSSGGGGGLAVAVDMNGVVSNRRRGGLYTAAASLQCASPRRIISRCLAALRPAARERKGAFGGLESEGVSVLARCSTNLPSSVGSPGSAPESDDSGRCRTDSSFNMGVACGLLYLIGASRNEMTKMVEVREQMEMLLQNFRDELQNKSSPFKTIEPNLARSTNSEPLISAQTNSPWTTSYVVPESETILECDGDSSQCVDELDQRCIPEMDELEAELEAELELLEINLDTGHSSKITNQRPLKLVMDNSSSSSASHSTSSGEIIIEPQEIRTEVNSEVSPIELERKLHELLEARQQERIRELEEALDRTKIKLREKELEISWWKDTARIISHHFPESPRSFAEQNPKSLQLLR